MVKTLAEACQKTGGQVHAYCLMTGGRQRFEQMMERRREQETDPELLKALRRGWCVGGGGFKREMLARMEGRLGEHPAGELHHQAAPAKGERIVAEELRRRGWAEGELARRGKSDADKLEIAAPLRR